ncbi:hypothetical protein P8452_17380 [Trifolium repens]|nr:hypothetical protein P8452_17380 [Trifolium repens]
MDPDMIKKSLIATVSSTNLQSIPQVPYTTARIFRSQFTYSFNVNSDYFNLEYLMKEFVVHVNGNSLQLTFAPSSNDSDSYAFVNGIEVVSIPHGLYIGGDDSPIPLVGHYPNVVYIYNDSAMENMYRLNVGGEQIKPKYDTGMFRNWDIDDGSIFGADAGIKPFDETMKVLYNDHVPAYTAPSDVYRTSRSMATYEKGLVNLNYNLTWFFPVDSGFLYLIRLHFCEIYYAITMVNEVVFSVFLNNQTAEKELDPVGMSGGPGVPIYKDFVVMVPKDSDAKQDLWLDLHPYKPQPFQTEVWIVYDHSYTSCVAMKCLAERGVERPSTGDVLQDLFAAMKFQKNGGNVQNGKFSRNDDLKDYSDLTPGIEFSDIMMPIGR